MSSLSMNCMDSKYFTRILVILGLFISITENIQDQVVLNQELANADVDIDGYLYFMNFKLLLLFLLIAAGVFVNKKWSLLLSALGAIWVLYEYVMWFARSYRFARNPYAGSIVLTNRKAFLLGASWGNVFLLLITILLLLLVIKSIAFSRSSS